MEPGAGEHTPLDIDVERNALLYLAAWSAGREKLLGERFGDTTLASALTDLAGLTARGQRQSPRLVVLERMVRAAARRKGEFLATENASRLQLHAELIKAVPDDVNRVPGAPSVIDLPEPTTGIDAIERALNEIESGEGVVPANAYRSFATSEAAISVLHLQPHEREAPACDDSGTDRPLGGTPANEVSAEFTSSRPFTDFEQWLDPKAWPGLCPWFFRGMPPITARVPKPAVPNVHLGGWWQVLDERVLLVADDEWTTCLRFDQLRKTTELTTEYELAQHEDAPAHLLPTGSGAFAPPHPLHLVVDHGFLRATDVHDLLQPPIKTQLSLTKIVWFDNPDYDEWTSLLCDTFWLDLAMAMADAAATTPP